jgi:lipopolysaccharide biosynthesis glycosyltransferase
MVQGEQGVVYVAYGEAARDCLMSSMRSLHSVHPGMPMTVITDEQFPNGVNCIIREDDHIGARLARFEVAMRTPYDKTCYLDVDTTVLASLQPGFDILDGFDLALAMDGKHTVHYVARMTSRVPFTREEVQVTVREVGTGMVTLHNCGLIFFKPVPSIQRLFQVWKAEWERFGKRDQLAFVRALQQNPVRMVTLPHWWNTGHTPKAEVILHHWGDARRKGAP